MVMQLMNSNRWGVYAGSGNGTWDRMGAVDSRGISCCGNDTVGAKRIFQIRGLNVWWKATVGSLFSGRENTKEEDEKADRNSQAIHRCGPTGSPSFSQSAQLLRQPWEPAI